MIREDKYIDNAIEEDELMSEGGAGASMLFSCSAGANAMNRT